MTTRPATNSTQADDTAKQHTTTTSATSTNGTIANTDIDSETLPALHFSFKWRPIIIYISFLLICNVLIPCLLFYLLQNFTSITTKELIGISSAALGLSSCFDAPFRLYRLVRYRRNYGPLGSDIWWHLDFVMWTYTFALLIFAIPLAVAPAIAFYDFFLMSTTMLILPIGVVFLFSLGGFKLPCRCSSDTKGTPMKPAVFYTMEDIAAVDFKHGREFRTALYKRYTMSPPFQRLMYHLTIYWTLQCALYAAITAAVTWGSQLNFAFGWVLGQLFLWIGVSAIGCTMLVRMGKNKEKRWWMERTGEWITQVGEKRPMGPKRETSEHRWERV